jgi:acetyltransferase-like isoleucine patch superfamily enzyme
MLNSAQTKSLDRIADAHIVFAHQSVGQNVIDGVRELLAPRTLAWRLERLGRNGDPVSKMDAFRRMMLEGTGRRAEIALFTLCYVDFHACVDAEELFFRYAGMMGDLRHALPRTRFVHVTAPLTVVASGAKAWLGRRLGRAPGGGSENEKRHAYNEQLRAAFSGREPLFDLAALEADGATRPGDLPQLSPHFTNDGGHLNARGRAMVAWELVRLLDELTREISAEPLPSSVRSGSRNDALGRVASFEGAAGSGDRRFHDGVWVHGGGRLSIGQRTRLDTRKAGIELKVEKGAELAIGEDVVIEAGTSIDAQERIVIGDRCRIGKDCKLLDNHLHRVRGDRLSRPPSVPLVLEPDVTLEDHVVLLPGAWLEQGVRVGSGAVVSWRVPAGTMVPARPVHPSRRRDARVPS